jgi:hypothetical protein
MTKNTQYIVVIGTPDLIGGTFYGPFSSEVNASVWAQNFYPTTAKTGRVWNVVRLNSSERN